MTTKHDRELLEAVAEAIRGIADDRVVFRGLGPNQFAIAALDVATPIIERRLLERLAAEARSCKIPDSEGGWDIRYDVEDWLRDKAKYFAG